MIKAFQEYQTFNTVPVVNSLGLGSVTTGLSGIAATYTSAASALGGH